MKNRKMAYCASFAALATVFLIIGFYFQLLDIFCFLGAALCLTIPVKVANVKYSIISHVTICLAGLIFTGFYFIYILPFFLTGFIVIFANKIKSKWIRFAFGCGLFEIAFFIYMFLMGEALEINDKIDSILPFIIFCFGIPCYLLFYGAIVKMKIKIFNILGIE